jgi:hypothetical protein
MPRSSRTVLTAAMLAAACSQALGVDQAAPLPKATTDLLQVYPGARAYQEQGQVRIIYGVPMGGGATPQAAATDWLTQNAAAFGAGDLELTQEWASTVMDGRFTVFGYQQAINGVPVEYGMARVLVLNNGSNQVVYAAGNLAPRPATGFPQPVLNADQAQQVASAEKDAEGMKTWSAATLVVFQGEGDWTTPVQTWKVSGRGEGSNAKTFFVDAATGRVVYTRNDVYHFDVNGTVQGWAGGLYPPDATYPEGALSLQPVPELKVSIVGGNSVYADRNGAFTVPNSGTSPVTVGTGVNASADGFGGPWFSVQTSHAETASQTVTPPGPASLILNPNGSTDPTGNVAIVIATAEVNAAICTDLSHNYFKDRAPGFYPVDNQVIPQTGIPGGCNADYFTPYLQLGAAGSGCANMAYSTIISHEYGHFIVERLGLPQNAFGEGYSDTNAAMIWNDSVSARGINGTPDSFGRDPIAANVQYPCSNPACPLDSVGNPEIHCCGQILSGVWWRIRSNYGTLMGDPAGLEAARSLEVAWSLITTGGESSTNPAGYSTAIQVLTLDDDDGNIGTGTPHYDQIAAAFAAHSITVPPIQPIAFQYPAGRPTIVTPNQPTNIAVNVVGLDGSLPQPGTGLLSYRIGNSGSFGTIPMTQGAPNQYTATLPAEPCPSTIQYFFTAQSSTGAAQSDPPQAPFPSFSAVASAGSTTAVDLNMDTDPGWTVTNDPSLTKGAWERAVPVVPTSYLAPYSGFGGSGQCWVTDNRAYTPGVYYGVSGGPTTLTTAAYDLSAYGDADISYARWMESRYPGPALTVQVSSDNGATWTTVETVSRSVQAGGTPGGWIVNTFRLSSYGPVSSHVRVRFQVSNNNGGGVTEAGIDAFKIVGYPCTQTCYANCDGSTTVPVLNVLDFTCFLQKFAAGNSYANCDNSTTPPVLNVLDFTCFLQKFAAGCP